MSLNEKQMQQEAEKHEKFIKTYVKEPRLSKVLSMLESIGEEQYYGSTYEKNEKHDPFVHPVGYIQYVNNVVLVASRLNKAYKDLHVDENYTIEEIVFVSLFHGLGRVGLKGKPNFLPETDQWQRSNRGICYKPNDKLPYMTYSDRALFILQSYGITCTMNEYLGIMLIDGFHVEKNRSYLATFNVEKLIPSPLILLMQQARDFVLDKHRREINKVNQT